MSLKLVLEMENDQPDNVEVLKEVDAAEVAAEVEVGSSELNDDASEVEDYSEGIDTSIDAAGELDEVHDQLAESVENGEGASEETAKMTEIAVEAICAKVGIYFDKGRVVPAMESFGSANSRLHATKLAMEGIKEQVVRIWKAVKEAFVKVWEIAKGFYKTLVDNRSRLEKYLVGLKENAKKADGAPKSEKITAGAKAFAIGSSTSGEDYGAKNVISILEDTIKLCDVANRASQDLMKFTKDVIDGKADASAEAIMDRFKEIKGVGQSAAGIDDYTTYAYGRFIHSAYFEPSDQNKKGYVVIKMSTLPKVFIGKEITAPTKDEIGKVLDLALSNLKKLVDFDKASKTLEQANKAAVSFTDRMIGLQKNDNNTSSTDKENDVKSRQLLKSVNTMIATLGTSIPSVIYNGSKAAADYAAAGIANLGTSGS